MKKLIVFAALISVAACAGEASEEAPAEQAVAEKTEVNAMTVTNGDGETASLVLYDDGTYLFGDATGTYSEKDGMTCYVSDEGNNEESCWSAPVEGEDGTVTSTSADGVTVTLSEPTA
jgi:hypothetical protein